ncbi:hypothetical protein [Minwuia thermotolerans]|uniref:Uncharacterized protein n=1 Tax=Minwuia thermotolerans TaxID=2056226 RepID=A0A2M9G2J6_9PROT|nr:hypothetical protein [Minwuia thermotolerans]PJK29928.1 hypothetical protein CVT23_09165 [Minwuia thermotolerans]
MLHLHDPLTAAPGHAAGALKGRTETAIDREIARHHAAARAAAPCAQSAVREPDDDGHGMDGQRMDGQPGADAPLRTREMAEALAAEWVRRGPDAQITERDMRRAGFSQAEIDALGDDAVAEAHRILADLGRGSAA